MNPTYYDVLGVAPDATRDEIKQAWRDAADRFEPGSGGGTAQFQLFNKAAEVLLDPEQRRAYDAQLADDGRRGKPGRAPAAEAAAPAAAPATKASPTQSPSHPSPAPETPRARGGLGGGESGLRPVPLPVVAVLGVLAAVLVGLGTYFALQARQAADYQEALDRAPAAAERAAVAVLSYDHESLRADRDAAARFLTSGYRQEYLSTFDRLVTESATETRATVEAQVLASSTVVVPSGEDHPDEVPVLLFVNQTTTSTAGGGEPSTALNRVRLDMRNVDGTWLVDGITSY